MGYTQQTPKLTEDELTQIIKDGLEIYFVPKSQTPADSLYLSNINIRDVISEDVMRRHNVDPETVYRTMHIPHNDQRPSLHFRLHPIDSLRKALDTMVYGNTGNLSDKYFLEVVKRDDGEHMLYARYQYIIGSRLLGELTPNILNIIKNRSEAMFDDVLHQYIPKIKIEPANQAVKEAAMNSKVEINPNSPIGRIIPFLKTVEFVNDEATELKLAGQMDAKDYLVIKKVFEDMGGKWRRSTGTHIFETSPMDRIVNIIETGEFKKTYNLGYFPTPPELTEDVILPSLRAAYFPGMRVLEPSIGQGHIADKLKSEFPEIEIVGIELNPKNHEISSKKHDVILGNFLEQEPGAHFDAVIMNPPFEKQQDITHVEHALNFLKPGGLLISIMSASASFRTDKKTQNFRDLVAEMGGSITENERGAFSSSGTQVHTVTVRMTNRPKLTMRM